MEKFSIESKVVYSIRTVDGTFEAVGHKGLTDYCDNILGAFVDRMRSSRPHNAIKAAQHDHDFLMENREELKLIYEMIDQIDAIKNPPADHECSDYYCNRCGSGSQIEYVGD